MSPVLPVAAAAAIADCASHDLPTFVQGSTDCSSTTSSYLAHSQPFLIVPSLQHSQLLLPDATMLRPRPSFPVRPPMDNASKSKIQQQLNQSTFKAPAHKHAHHLHSIPPKEKTTRTLILDHLLWLHGRARFAQARAELGMNTPSNVEEVEDDPAYASDGEDVSPLGYAPKDGRSYAAYASDAASSSGSTKISAAKGFKARADGLEKVLSAMLDQPPEDLPFDQDDLLFNDTSFTPPVVPTLPNGVRLRIALAGLVNDLFAEDNQTLSRHDPPNATGHISLSAYTPTLSTLARVSAFAHHSNLPILPSFQTFSAAAGAGQNSLAPPPGSIFSTIPRGAGPEGPWALGGSATHMSGSGDHPGSSSKNNNSTRSFASYVPPPSRPSGSSSHFGPSSSSGRGFASGFPLSLPLEMDENAAPPPRVFRAVGRSRDLYNAGAHAYPVRAGEHPQRPRRCPRHLAITCPPSSTCTHTALNVSPKLIKSSRHKSSIGAGLGHSGPPLRRSKFTGPARGKEARMTDLIPRFLRLSALVAVELGLEARGEDWETLVAMDLNVQRQHRDSVGANPSSLNSNLSAESDEDSLRGKGKKTVPARPSRAWYALLSGLLVRAVLQGYLVKGWRGTDPVEILLGIGTGSSNPFTANSPTSPTRAGMENSAIQDDDDDIEDYEKEFEPEDMPDLAEAWEVLFGAKHAAQTASETFMTRAKGDLDEYEKVMTERTSEFFTISPNSGDLSLHLEDLARKYPSEPVERAALRFFEAVARWRGRPELETYKSNNPQATPTSASPQLLSIHSLIHPQPQAPSTSFIERYFNIPKASELEAEREHSRRRDSVSSSASGTKRSRRGSWAEGSKGKKVVIAHQAWVEEDEYVGPYGI